jgi:hypothetical protein
MRAKMNIKPVPLTANCFVIVDPFPITAASIVLEE